MIKKLSVAALVFAVAITGCDKMKDALSAHSNNAAKANDDELTATDLANLLGASQAPLRKEVINAVVDAWVDYHLVAEAAVNNDSLSDPKLADEAMWAAIDNIKAKKWYDIVSKSWREPDSASAEAFYNNGQVLAASHILLMTQGKSDAEKAAIKKKADAIHAQLTSANFATMAQKNSEDPGSKVKGGSLGTFPPGSMVPQFEQALIATKPGEISPVFETQYGYHIIRRPTFAEVKTDIIQASRQRGMQVAESTYLATLEKTHDMKIKPGTEATVRAVVLDPGLHQSDKTVLATTDMGDFTAAKLARWVTTIPPQAQIAQRIQSAPDSLIPAFIRNFIRNELVIHTADSAKLGPDPQQLAEIRKYLPNSIVASWTALKVDPKTLAAAGSSKGDRIKAANQKVDQYVRDLLSQKAQFVDVTQPTQYALRKKYDYEINGSAVARALIEAANVRLKTDSTKSAGQPPTAVPLPKADTTKR
jgi:parvulin-like peptidyl-prolyl isomerase